MSNNFIIKTISQTISSWLGIYDISPTDAFIRIAGERMCREKAITQTICKNLLFLIMGYASDQLNTVYDWMYSSINNLNISKWYLYLSQTLFPIFLGHSPSGSATNQLLHYGQEVNSGHFRQFDFGYIKNLFHYKSLSPPDYDLKNVKVPVALYYAQSDWLATTKDVKRLLKMLPNVIQAYLIPHKKFNHIDFLWGIDAPKLLYEAIFKVITLTETNEI